MSSSGYMRICGSNIRIPLPFTPDDDNPAKSAACHVFCMSEEDGEEEDA